MALRLVVPAAVAQPAASDDPRGPTTTVCGSVAANTTAVTTPLFSSDVFAF